MKYVYILIAIILTGCTKNTDTASALQQLSSLLESLSVENFSDALAVGDKTYLISSETQGLLLKQNNNLNTLSDGQFEAMGVFDNNHYGVVDAGANQLLVFSLIANQFIKNTSIPAKGFQLKNFCTYHSLIDDNYYVFLLDGDGLVEQFLVKNKTGFLTSPVKMKRFHVGAEVTNCVALSKTQRVYFTEAKVGLFEYKAEPESDLKRRLIAAAEPAGTLSKNISAVVSMNEHLLAVLNEDTAMINWVSLTNKGAKIDRLMIEQQKGVAFQTLHRIPGGIMAVDQSNGKLYDIPVAEKPVKVDQVKPTTPTFSVKATIETPPMRDTGDAADDPAIWYNSTNPEQSLVLGTNKKQGLLVYGLDGQLRQTLPHGHINNVDIRYGITLRGKTIDIAASSNRSNNSISLYTIDREARHVSLEADIPLTMTEPYGLCMGQKDNEITIWVNDKSGLFEAYQVISTGDTLKAEKKQTFRLASQPEGCVVDDKTQRLFVGEENVGVWVIDVLAKNLKPTPVIQVGGAVKADVEGLSIAYQGINGKDVLVISSQGDNSFVLVETEAPFTVVGKFRIGINLEKGIDGVSETDGLAVSTKDFGGQFSQGLLVTQDGYNIMPNTAQNFKFIPWQSIQKNKVFSAQ